MRMLALFMVLPLALVACDKEEFGYDEALLAKYRLAIPSEGQLAAKKPQGTTTNAIGDPAIYPHAAVPLAIQINLAAVGIVRLMRTITSLEPTLYNSDTKEFLWGPWDNNDDFGTVAAYIKELPEGEEFRYVYALLRGLNTDISTMKPVVWGASTPDPNNESYGVGITLWDFEANFDFAKTNDPDFALKTFDRGRFVAVYGAGDDEENPGARVLWDYAVFKNFIGKDNYDPSADPTAVGVDLDYLYGHYVGTDGNVLDFLHFELSEDIEDTPTDALEDISVRMAFLNSGWGRAEALASNGDLTAPSSFSATECWDTALDETYLNYVYTDLSGNPTVATLGAEAGCGPDLGSGVMLFARTLDELGIPTLDDIDPAMKAALASVAENGMPQE